MSSDKLPQCPLLDCITESDARSKCVQQNLNNLAIIFLLKSCEKIEKKVEAPKPKSKRGRKPKPNSKPPKVKKAEKEEYKQIIEVFRKWNKTHDITSTCSCGTCKFCKISESVKNCTNKKVQTKRRRNKGAVQQQDVVQCEVCDWPEDLQELLCDWDELPGTSKISDISNKIEKYMMEHNNPNMYDLYSMDEVLVNPVKKGKKSAIGRVSKAMKATASKNTTASRNTTKKSVRRGQPQTGRGGSNSLKYRRIHCVPSVPSSENNENVGPVQNGNGVELDRIELSSNISDTLSSKDVINKVSVEFTKYLPYDILELRPTLAENYERAKASDYFLNSK